MSDSEAYAARVVRFLDAWDAAPVQRTSPRHVISTQSTPGGDEPYAKLVDTDLRGLVARNRQLERDLADARETLDSLRLEAQEGPR